MNVAVQLASLVGAALILGAYVSLQRGWWTPAGRGYLWCNFLGAAILTGVAVWDRRFGFIVLEVVWALVSGWSLVRPSRVGAPKPG